MRDHKLIRQGLIFVLVTVAGALTLSCARSSGKAEILTTPGGPAVAVASSAAIATANAGTPVMATPAPTATVSAVASPTTLPLSSPTANPSPTSKPQATPSPKPTSLPSPTVATQTKAAVNPGTVLAYYVPYDPTSWHSLEAHADSIDYVAPQWVTIDACGNIGSRDNLTLVAFARSRGIRILPSLLTSNADLNHHLLTNGTSAARAVEQIVDYVVSEGYDGLDLDLENIKPGDRAAYTEFVRQLSVAMHRKGKMLTAAIPAKTYDATTGWAGAYDYAAIGPHFDLITIMTYEYSSPTGKPGSTAPLDWVDRVISFATNQIAPERVLVGIAFYGYDWDITNGGRARSLRYPQAAALARKFGIPIALDPATKSATFSYTLRAGDSLPPDEKLPAVSHEIKVRQAPACPLSTPTPAPRPMTPQPTPTPSLPQEHVVWLEDARSVSARLAVATKYGAAGAGAWRLGQEDPAVWKVFATWRQTSR